MPRPIEYENLIKTRALEAVQPTPGAVQGFLKNAESFLALSKALLSGAPLATEPMQVFTNAYEGYHQVVQAVLEFHEVRTKEAGRHHPRARPAQRHVLPLAVPASVQGRRGYDGRHSGEVPSGGPRAHGHARLIKNPVRGFGQPATQQRRPSPGDLRHDHRRHL